jgi:hypothetical protein
MNLSCREVRKRKNGIDKKPLIKGKSTEKNWFPEADINRYFSRSQRQRNAAVVKSYRLILSALNFSLESIRNRSQYTYWIYWPTTGGNQWLM